MRLDARHKLLDRWLGKVGIALLSPGVLRRGGELSGERFTRILVVKLSALGDTVVLVPALRALRERYPDAQIGMVGTEVNREIVAEYPQYIDRFYCLDVRSAVQHPTSFWRFVRELRAGGWEIGVDFDQWTNITPILLRLVGVPVRIGFRTAARVRHQLYTHTCRRRANGHEAENFLRLLTPLGIESPEPPRLELSIDPRAVAHVRALLQARGWNGRDPLVILHPGAGPPDSLRAQRAWPVSRYAELVRRMRLHPRVFFAITGTPAEAPAMQELVAAVSGTGCLLCGLELRELIASLSLARLVISGNTGPMHLAAALGVPQVALHGPAGAEKWGPLNPNAVVIESSCPECPCLDMGWEYHRTDGYCMEQIGVQEVLGHAERVLQTGVPSGLISHGS